MSEDKTEAVMCEAMISVVAHLFWAMYKSGASGKICNTLISYVCQKSTDTHTDAEALFEAGKKQSLEVAKYELGETTSGPSEQRESPAGFITTATMIAKVAAAGLCVGLTPVKISEVVDYLIKKHSNSSESEQRLRDKSREISLEFLLEVAGKPSDDTPEIEVELEAADS
ncbi:hypothetical protein [Microbulbifer epialgicus]|uniref:Uncharacterized protein n=1 Tax=Microbulbifer epialgicus TaxID=393907 RepID=A0ABV4P3A2_9GAMM